MFKLDDISKICSGLAWGRNLNPLVDKFEVNVFLPFPFYDALQRELSELMSSMVTETRDIKPTEPLKFIDIQFPNGVLAHIQPSDKSIVFEPVTKELKVVHLKPQGGFLKPGGNRA